jgi:aspartate racemase
MPCNTAHAFAPAIRKAVSIPLVSIIDVTVDACAGFDKVGVMATAGCLEARLYQDALTGAGMTPVLPNETEVAEISQLAIEIKLGHRGAEIRERMQAVAQALATRGAQVLVAACTEIPLVLDAGMIDIPLVSSTDALAAVTAAICAGERSVS